jgi:threonine dehydrogenase-like Zn-dependent dehydrogenase
MGHEFCGILEEVGSAVKTVKPGQFVIGSFCISDNTCPICRAGYQSGRQNLEFMTGAPHPITPGQRTATRLYGLVEEGYARKQQAVAINAE